MSASLFPTSVKAVEEDGAWTLHVLAAPFGGPNRKDGHGEFFDAQTDFAEAYYPEIPAVYYHGYDGQTKRPAAKPAYVGRGVKTWVDAQGRWYKVILDQTKALAQRVWDAAQRGNAKCSPGSAEHLIRRSPGGHLDCWPIVEISVFDTELGQRPANPYAVALPAMKALYSEAGIALPQIDISPDADPQARATGQPRHSAPAAVPTSSPIHTATPQEDRSMTDEEMQVQVATTVAAAVKAALDARDAEAKAQAEREAAIAKEVETRVATMKAEMDAQAAASRRLPYGTTGSEGPYATKYGELARYDNLTAADQAVLCGVLQAAKRGGQSVFGASNSALKALAVKLGEDQSRVGEVGRNACKAVGLSVKADEIQQQDLVGFGDEWVGVGYSQSIWDAIRQDTFVAARIPAIEVPQGQESIYLPLEGADPVFYKVAEATDTATTGWPNATVTSSQMATDRKQVTLAKMGARVLWSGELEEDSLIPFANQLRMQLSKAGTEQLEHAVIDGDTATAATTNINHIGGTPTATDLYLLFNGLRKLALVTNTANSRDGGVLASADFLETIKLMGAAGINALDSTKVSFIIDPNVHWKALELADVKTRDVYAGATIEEGKLVRIYGYQVDISAFMHYKSATRKANASGKVDQTTPGNNTTGSILSVRWDQILMAFRRRMTLETTRIPRADATEIVALMRLGLVQRDNEATAISYNITV